MKTKTLRLTIDVTYSLHGAKLRDLEKLLNYGAVQLAGEGMFTGSTLAEVETWTHKVEEIKA